MVATANATLSRGYTHFKRVRTISRMRWRSSRRGFRMLGFRWVERCWRAKAQGRRSL
jgi:hypothetical protein